MSLGQTLKVLIGMRDCFLDRKSQMFDLREEKGSSYLWKSEDVKLSFEIFWICKEGLCLL